MQNNLNRPDWDLYFITMCYLVAQRSIDPNTKCGAVAINKDRAILSTGYNSPPRGYPDHLADLTRPNKYLIMEHAERNMIANAARIGVSLLDSTVYVTGPPCSDCFRIMWNSGVKHIIYGENHAKMLENESHISRDFIDPKQVLMPTLTEFKGLPDELLEKTLNYIEKKRKSLRS